MIAKGFKSVIWVATVGSAALGCYMVSLRVATERNELAKVERQIIDARRDIRSLQTELGTRGRMTQLEQWNAEVLALSAPNSQQFLKDEFTLARLYRNDPTVAERSAEMRLASAEAPVAKPAEAAKPAAPAVVHAVAEPATPPPPMIHRASFAAAEAKPAVARSDKPAPVAVRANAKPPAKPDTQRTAAAAPTKPEASPANPGAKPATLAAKTETKPATSAAKPRTKPAAASAKPATIAAKPASAAAKPAAKPATIAAKPLREAAAAPRQAKPKASGGN